MDHTSKLFTQDRSIYCISAINPLQPSLIEHRTPAGDPNKMLRVDHFVGQGATLIPRKVSEEILEKYVVHELKIGTKDNLHRSISPLVCYIILLPF